MLRGDMQMFSPTLLQGKTALVTGASSGLGMHFAATLTSAGATVVLAARRREPLESAAAELRAKGAKAHVVVVDIRDPSSVASATESAIGLAGRIDILVNNSGIGVTKPVLEQSEEDWQSVLDTNLSGAFRMAQAMARHMVAHGQGGSIINVASILGRRVMPQVPAYVASKAGLIRLTEALAIELARYRIRVNAIAPGYVQTEINREVFAGPAGDAIIKRIPQRRVGKPEDLDGALLLLASDASGFMTGSVVTVDGGHSVNSM